MKHGYVALVRLLLLAFLLFPSIGVLGQSAGSSSTTEIMSVLRARRTLAAAAVFHPDKYNPKVYWYHGDRIFIIYGASFRFTPDALEFDEVSVKLGTRHSRFDLKTLVPMSATCEDPSYQTRYPCHLKTLTGKPFGKDNLMPDFVASLWDQRMIDPATAVRLNLDFPPSSSLPCMVYRDFRVSTI